MPFPRLPLLSEESEPDLQLGGDIFTLLDDPTEWIHRRVDAASFIDAVSIRRRVSVDFDMPVREGERFHLVPLAFLDKRPLMNLDIRDEGGAACPVLNADENAFVAWSVLARLLKGIVEVVEPAEEVPAHVLEALKDVVRGTPPKARQVLESLQETEAPVLRHVLNVPVFTEYAKLLAARFLLLVELRETDARRRVLKFSYTESFQPQTLRALRSQLPESGWRDTLWRSVLRRAEKVGWRATEANVEVPGVGEGQSFHFEFLGPPGLQVKRAEMFCVNQTDDDDQGRTHRAQVVGSRAHIYTATEDISVDGTASVWLHPARPGLLRAALSTSAVIGAVIAFFHSDGRIADVQEARALPLLLVAPGLVASFIVRPGEHGMTTDLLLGIRATVGVSALCAYAGAIGLAGGLADSTLRTLWTFLGIVTALCFTVLSVAWFAAGGRTGEEGDDG